MTHDSDIDPATAAWLLDPSNPTVRRLAGARLGIGDAGTSGPTADEPWIRTLLAEPVADEDGTLIHPYHKWRGVHWRLLALAELGADPAEPAIARVAEDGFERVAAWVSGASRLRASRVIEGRVRQCASMDGNAVLAAVSLGLGGDPRTAAIVERLLDWQWPDGGWNCDRRPAAGHSSFNETFGPLRGLAAYALRHAGGQTASDALAGADRAAEFVLMHRVDRSHRTGMLAHPALERRRWPAYWHYDRLQGLRSLREAGRLEDPRTCDAIDDLRRARRPDGRWTADGRYWAGPHRSGSNVDCVAWGADGESRMLTLQALEVLAGA